MMIYIFGDKMAEKKEMNYGIWTTVVGAILILIDGIAVAYTKKFYAPWYVGNAATVAAVEIILSLIIFGLLYFYKKNAMAIGWSIFVLALITLAFDGGFWYIGAIISMIGGVLVAYEK